MSGWESVWEWCEGSFKEVRDPLLVFFWRRASLRNILADSSALIICLRIEAVSSCPGWRRLQPVSGGKSSGFQLLVGGVDGGLSSVAGGLSGLVQGWVCGRLGESVSTVDRGGREPFVWRIWCGVQ